MTADDLIDLDTESSRRAVDGTARRPQGAGSVTGAPLPP